MRLFAGVLFGLGMIVVGSILLVSHKRIASFWRSIGLGARGGKLWYFSVYQLGPLLLIGGGGVVVILGVLGAFGLGPAPYKR
jgi:hypothetical protein